ncbi:hypothetical protein TNCV_383211 [Trichonephila clavipes]|nr:hypothetical protein TNCV_383211 [Trichonephila clavipes]
MPTEQEAKPSCSNTFVKAAMEEPIDLPRSAWEDPLKWLKEYDRANFNKWDDMMCLANVFSFLAELRDSGMSTTKTPRFLGV